MKPCEHEWTVVGHKDAQFAGNDDHRFDAPVWWCRRCGTIRENFGHYTYRYPALFKHKEETP